VSSSARTRLSLDDAAALARELALRVLRLGGVRTADGLALTGDCLGSRPGTGSSTWSSSAAICPGQLGGVGAHGIGEAVAVVVEQPDGSGACGVDPVGAAIGAFVGDDACVEQFGGLAGDRAERRVLGP
jgi:hypothetical protein